MKKIIALMMLVIMSVAVASAQPKNTDKDAWKTAKKQAKALTKAGWKVDGSLPLENYLYEHYKALTDKNNREETGPVMGNSKINTVFKAKTFALNMACVNYAKTAGSTLKGVVSMEVGEIPESFYEAYESLVQKEIRGELKKSYGIYKVNEDGSVSYTALYIVNENEASKARMRAMEMAMKESEFARQNADAISKYVQERFDE